MLLSRKIKAILLLGREEKVGPKEAKIKSKLLNKYKYLRKIKSKGEEAGQKEQKINKIQAKI